MLRHLALCVYVCLLASPVEIVLDRRLGDVTSMVVVKATYTLPPRLFMSLFPRLLGYVTRNPPDGGESILIFLHNLLIFFSFTRAPLTATRLRSRTMKGSMKKTTPNRPNFPPKFPRREPGPPGPSPFYPTTTPRLS